MGLYMIAHISSIPHVSSAPCGGTEWISVQATTRGTLLSTNCTHHLSLGRVEVKIVKTLQRERERERERER
jgi:hypothetical protein